jgi:hypothetical protein
LLTASELRSADRYWHIIEASGRRQYPTEYQHNVIGMMWNTMAQFQTWFGSAEYLPTGIQLIPLTSVSEERDSIEWVSATISQLLVASRNELFFRNDRNICLRKFPPLFRFPGSRIVREIR